MSADLWLMLARFGAACAGSMVVAALIGALLRMSCARWPALRAHRSVWLLAQAAVVLSFVLALAPLARSPITPTLSLAPAAVSLTDNHDAVQAPADAIVAAPAATPAPQDTSAWPDLATTALHLLPAAWLTVYLAGLATQMLRRWRNGRRWQMLLREHTRLMSDAELQACAAMTPAQRATIEGAGLAVRTTALQLSPLLHGVRRPCLLLPAHLSSMDAVQQQLIVEHELTHWRRADPLWLTLSGALALAFWFNRPLQRLDQAVREAVELGCDDAVLAQRPTAERRSYAAALVAQLRMQACWQGPADAACGAAFGAAGTDMTQRVQRMRMPDPLRLSARSRALAGALAAGIALLATAMQPAFSPAPPAAPSGDVATVDAPAAPAAPSAPSAAHEHEAWRYPLERSRVTSLYGVRSPSRPTGHHGVDFAARRGTPVHAVAAGAVLEAAYDEAWGHYVRIGHGGGRSSLLMHLERIDVEPGQLVAAGEALGTAGASGKATGPHLHLEYWQDGRRLDPRLVLPDLFGHATSKALAQRATQGNPLPTDL